MVDPLHRTGIQPVPFQALARLASMPLFCSALGCFAPVTHISETIVELEPFEYPVRYCQWWCSTHAAVHDNDDVEEVR